MVGFSLAKGHITLKNLLGKRWAPGRSHVDGREFAGCGRLVLSPPLSGEVAVESPWGSSEEFSRLKIMTRPGKR